MSMNAYTTFLSCFLFVCQDKIDMNPTPSAESLVPCRCSQSTRTEVLRAT